MLFITGSMFSQIINGYMEVFMTCINLWSCFPEWRFNDIIYPIIARFPTCLMW